MQVLPIYVMPIRVTFLVFLIMSFIGWCSEVLYVGLFFEHKFVNRGFLHGPLCPIYGCGGLAILFLPSAIYSTWIPMFFASMILGSLVEYASSWLMEKLFHARWWDYSHYKFHINGRICLLNSVLFGLMGVLIIHFIMPYIMLFISKLSELTIVISTDIFAAVLLVDLLITVRRLVDFHGTMVRIKTFGESLYAHYEKEQWFNGESLSSAFASVKKRAQDKRGEINQSIIERIEQLQQKMNNVESFLHRFPSMKSYHYKEELKLLRERMAERKNKIKDRFSK